MKKLILIALYLLSTSLHAQTPKWADKARKAVVSVITYDKDNNIKATGNGFFIRDNGTAVADYTLFKGAERAVVIDTDGKEYPVDCILGANSIYDVVKFRIKTDAKMSFLTPATTAVAQGGAVYLLPYASQKDAAPQKGTVSAATGIETKYQYYTLALKTNDKAVSLPVANAQGQVIGMIQRSAEADSPSSYALDASFAAGLTLGALSSMDYTLRSIGIRKGLPEDIKDAEVYLMMMSGNATPAEEYQALIEDFIRQFPTQHEGYLRRATYRISAAADSTGYPAAEADIQLAISQASKKDEALYSAAKLIFQAVAGGVKYQEWTLDRALTLVDEAIAVNPLPLYTQTKGDLYFARKDYAQAYDCYMAVNRSQLRSAESLFSAARCKQLLGTNDEALALMDSTVNFFGDQLTIKAAPYIFQRGQMKAEQQLFREAVLDYNEYERLSLGKATAEFYFIREQAEMQCRLYQQALNDINKAVEMQPGNVGYIVEQVAVCTRFAQHENAIEAARKGIAIDPENSDLYRMMGFCQLQLGLKQEGKASLLKAKELGDPNAEELIKKYAK